MRQKTLWTLLCLYGLAPQAVIAADTQTPCVRDAMAWSAQALILLRGVSSTPYERIEADALGTIPALEEVTLKLASTWPSSRTAFQVSGRNCVTGQAQQQMLWFKTRAYRQAWVYSLDGKAESSLATTKPVRELVDIAKWRLPEAELLIAPGDEVLTRSVSAGAPVRHSDVKPAPWVQRNANVLVVVQAPGVLIRTQGTALQHGQEGDWVPVMVIGASKSTRARVVAAGVVHVDI